MPMLLHEEAVNNWTIGILHDWMNGSRARVDGELTLLGVEGDGGEIVATGVSTGESLVVTRMGSEAVGVLVDFLVGEGIVQPKTSGPSESVRPLAAQWAERRNVGARVALAMQIMGASRVQIPPGISGQIRIATMDDLDLAAGWAEGFCRELGMPADIDRKNVGRRIELSRLYLWRDPEPVSMAALAGPTPNGVRVNLVYTPPGRRGKGYARGCVGRLSQMMLDAGKKFVFLYVDADNPTTNRLYSSLGYEAVCDWEDWWFEG
jgi:hypothetical protein